MARRLSLQGFENWAVESVKSGIAVSLSCILVASHFYTFQNKVKGIVCTNKRNFFPIATEM